MLVNTALLGNADDLSSRALKMYNNPLTATTPYPYYVSIEVIRENLSVFQNLEIAS